MIKDTKNKIRKMKVDNDIDVVGEDEDKYK
jgi:hypothetical protein